MYKAMIFAAGLGTRFKPWTDKHPKALAIVNRKSLLQRNIEYLQKYGITELIINVHHFADQILDEININKGWGSKITISDESDEVLETGGGLLKASWFFKGHPFFVINADVLTDLNLDAMKKTHEQSNPIATLAVTDRPSSRAFLFDNNETLCGWRNTKTLQEKISKNIEPLHPMSFSGIHIIDPKIFSLIPLYIFQKKFSIVDAYLEIAKNETIKGYDHSGSKFVDVGRTESVPIAEALFP